MQSSRDGAGRERHERTCCGSPEWCKGACDHDNALSVGRLTSLVSRGGGTPPYEFQAEIGDPFNR